MRRMAFLAIREKLVPKGVASKPSNWITIPLVTLGYKCTKRTLGRGAPPSKQLECKVLICKGNIGAIREKSII